MQSNRQDITGHNEIRNPDGDEKVLGTEPDVLRASGTEVPRAVALL